MNIKKMSNIIKIVIPVMLVITIILFLVLNALMAQVTQKREDGAKLADLGNTMLHNNNHLVKLMREFIITYDEKILQEHKTIIEDLSNLDGKLDEMKIIGLTDEEIVYTETLLDLLGELADIEDEAIAAYNAGNRERAAAIIQSPAYSTADYSLERNARELIGKIEERIHQESISLTNQGRVGLIIIGIFFVLSLVLLFIITNWFVGKANWYENILDNIPFPLSITDINMKWTFINRAVENFLGKKRSQVIGQHCSNWGAAICKTEKCGVTCLKRGETMTTFNQMNMDFRVDSAYLTDKNNKTIGHIEVVQDITKMVENQKNQNELVKEIKNISHAFVSATKQIADGAQTLAQGSTEQASTVEQLSSAVSDITQKTKTNAEMAGKAANLAETIKQNAEEGNKHMDEMMSAAEEINNASQEISKVIKTIDDIAFQTNILALNAAVEAARAGQHGKGFAVVAEEVRNLASKSAEAAKDTTGLIENSIEKAALGTKIANQTSQSLGEIMSGINESNEIVNEIAKSSGDQSMGISQINTGIEQVSSVVQQNSATAEESAASAEEMSTQSHLLEELVSRFKTD